MASHCARMSGRQQSPTSTDQLSVLAHAKPAIIASNVNSARLSDQLNSALTFSSMHAVASKTTSQSDIPSVFSDNELRTKSMVVEDENVIEKQNAANQMRHAAVLAASVASQQRQQQKRLSASERLAMSRPKPLPSNPTCTSSTSEQLRSLVAGLHSLPSLPQAQPPPPPPPMHQRPLRQSEPKQQQPSAPQQARQMPTLETLLAVQRQLQRHTRQNLSSSMPQDLVNERDRQNSVSHSDNKQPQQQQTQATNNQPVQIPADFETYEKELPPLPESISPSICTTTDESQLNSLESQSSPATSLVSLPPPPPPISSYLQQYDEAASRQSNNSTPQSQTTATSSCSSSEICSIKQFPILPIKQQHQQQTASIPPPLLPPSPLQAKPNHVFHQRAASLAPPPKVSPAPPPAATDGDDLAAPRSLPRRSSQAMPPPALVPPAPRPQQQLQSFPAPPLPPSPAPERNAAQQEPGKGQQLSHKQQQVPIVQRQQSDDADDCPPSKQPTGRQELSVDDYPKQQQISYQRHLFTPIQSFQQNAASHSLDSSLGNSPLSSAASPPVVMAPATTSATLIKPSPPAPLPSASGRHFPCGQLELCLPPAPAMSTATSGQLHQQLQATSCASRGGVSNFDEPDCGSIRFPSPPPPELLFAEQDEVDLLKNKAQHEDDCNQVADDDGDDADFQCRIPTPPAHESMAPESFHLLASSQQCQQRGANFSMPPPPPVVQFNSSSFSPMPPSSLQRASADSSPQPPPLFRQPQPTRLTVHIDEAQQRQLQQQHKRPLLAPPPPPPECRGLLSTAPDELPQKREQTGGGAAGEHLEKSSDEESTANHHHPRIMMSMVAASHRLHHSSSSPSSSSDGDNHSSNSSSSTSGVHSSIDSPISTTKSARHNININPNDQDDDDFDNYKRQLKQQFATAAANFAANPNHRHCLNAMQNLGSHQQHAAASRRLLSSSSSSSSALLTSIRQQAKIVPQQQQALGHQRRLNSTSSLSSVGSNLQQQVATSNIGGARLERAAHAAAAKPPRPALKQKKSVSFSDKIELVACADEEREAHLPNPLLARVLAGKMQ